MELTQLQPPYEVKIVYIAGENPRRIYNLNLVFDLMGINATRPS